MKKYIPVLEKCALFREMKAEDIEKMLSCMEAGKQHFEKGEIILAEGSPARRMGIILAGSVQVIRVDYDGNRSLMAHLEKSDLFAEAFAFAGIEKMPVHVVAAEETETLLLEAEKMLGTCLRACPFHRKMIDNLVRLLARKNLMFNQKLEVTSRRSTREKLMAYLIQQANRAGSASFQIPLDRQALADYLEVDRSGLSAEISKLRKEGVLLAQKNRFQLLSHGETEE